MDHGRQGRRPQAAAPASAAAAIERGPRPFGEKPPKKEASLIDEAGVMRLNDALGDKIADSLHLGTAVMNWQSGEEGMRRVSGAATYRFKRIFDRSHAHVRGVDRKMGFGRVRIDQRHIELDGPTGKCYGNDGEGAQ